MACYSYEQTGQCKFGNGCKFIHAGGSSDGYNRAPAAWNSQLAPATVQYAPPPALQYAAPGAVRGGPCYQWDQTATCRFGDACRFTHDARVVAQSYEYRRDRDRSPPRSDRDRYAERAARDSRYDSRNSSRSYDRFGGGSAPPSARDPGPCYQFERERTCQYGESCRFTHDGVLGSGAGRGGRGGGADRSAAGPCWQFAESGTCQYGEACRFQHDGAAPSSGSRPPRKEKDAGPCYAWKDSGSCQYGDSCRFSHDGGAARREGAGAGGPCFEFKDTGSCKFGSGCKFSHDGAAVSSSSAPASADDTFDGQPRRE